MTVYVVVKTNQRENAVTRTDASHFCVAVIARPVDGQANALVQQLLAKYFGVAKSCVTLRAGVKAKSKVFDIME